VPGHDGAVGSLGCDFLRLLLIDVGDHDARSFTGESESDRPPEVGRASGHDDDSAVQPEVHV